MTMKWSFIFLAGLLAHFNTFAAAPDLLLLKKYQPGLDTHGWLMSEKLDGIRAYWNGHELISRQGYRIDAPARFIQGFPPFEMDGELWVGRGRFEQTASVVASGASHPGWGEVGYYIFELPHGAGGLLHRLDRLRRFLQDQPLANLHLIEQQICQDETHLQQRLKQVEAKGGEGLVLRNPTAAYETGRSADALKVKSFEDREARVIGYRTGKGKYQGMTGALQVELDDGKRFYIGSGLTDEQRRHPPPTGSIITFKYTGLTRYGIPRFASFLRIRHAAGYNPAQSSTQELP
jgi:DNA ligase-1